MNSYILSKLSHKKFLIVAVSLFIILTSWAVVYAYNVCTTYCYDVSHGSSKQITAFDECRVVTNNSSVGGTLAIPIKNPGEWFRFRLAAGDTDPNGVAYYTGSGFTNYLQQHQVTVAKCAVDVCPNETGTQNTIPANEYVDLSGNCQPITISCPSGQFYNPYTQQCENLNTLDTAIGECTEFVTGYALLSVKDSLGNQHYLYDDNGGMGYTQCY